MAAAAAAAAISPNSSASLLSHSRSNTRLFCRLPFHFNSNFLGLPPLLPHPLSCSISTRNYSPGPVPISAAAASQSHAFDVVIIGAGIIGLTIARQLLLHSDLSVAIVDAAVPCSGATGAGQGYIWRIHKTPGSDKWELAMRSHQLWEMFADGVQQQGMSPLDTLGWKKTGSLLVGRSPEELDLLKRQMEQLSEAGLRAELLSSNDLLQEEPALGLGEEAGAVFLADDYQLDAKRTAAFIQKANRDFASRGRYMEFFNEPANSLRFGSSGEVEAVQTSKNVLYVNKAVVIAAGCWSGSLMHNLLKDLNVELVIPVKPRKGHLLVIENFNLFRLNHGLMEVGYVGHQDASLPSSDSDSAPLHDAQTTSVSMTATMDACGSLVLGSSRQLVGYSTELDESVINLIWERAGEFLPILKGVSLGDLQKGREVRVGLRPYMPDGKPVIGPVPGLSNVFLSTGHEGEGLSLALGTAEMVADMILGDPAKIDCTLFAMEDRCCQ